MPVRIYCDHSFLIKLGLAPADYKARLHRAIQAQELAFVVSTWHWVEMARSPNSSIALRLADFIDSLNPLWLRNRRHLQRDEVAGALFQSLGREAQLPVALVSLAGLLAEIDIVPSGDGKRWGSRDFVLYLRRSFSAMQRFIDANEGGAVLAGGFSEQHRREAIKRLIPALLPATAPDGAGLDPAAKARFLERFDVQACPCLAVEFALSEEGWKAVPKLDWASFMDRFHIVPALPYVDRIATDDHGLTDLINRIASLLPFPVARPMAKRDFDQSYMRDKSRSTAP